MAIDIGISDKDRAKIAESLSKMLADSYILYLKTHNFHWNVTGPMFQTLHILFMQQYTELWNALDLIAERIRSLGHPAPGSYKRYVELSSIEEEEGVPSATDMIRQIVAGQEAVTRTARAAFKVATPGCCARCWKTAAPGQRCRRWRKRAGSSYRRGQAGAPNQ